MCSPRLDLGQFGNMKITKDFLLQENQVVQMYIKDDFEFDDDVYAIFSVDNCEHGKSIVCHLKHGIFFVDRTSVKLINSYWKHNFRGFLISKAIARISKLTDHLPLVDGHIVYVPMSGKRSRNPDWVGLHHVEDYSEFAGKATIKTTGGMLLQLNICGMSLQKKVHDGSFMSEFHLGIITNTVRRYGSFKVDSSKAGITNKFIHCSCRFHSLIPRSEEEVHQFWSNLFTVLFNELAKSDVTMSVAKSFRVISSLFNKVRRW
jgi:hypothetical protein